MQTIGFTGTRKEITIAQHHAIHGLLTGIHSHTFHHGDCIGADAEAHKIAYALGYDIVVHPPLSTIQRAWCGQGETGVTILAPKPYLARNLDIVEDCDILIACSFTDHELQRSGTWMTVRNARVKGKDVHIIFPNGTVVKEENRTP